MKIQKKIGGGGVGLGGQGGCEWRSEAFVKIQKKIYIYFFFFFGGGGRVRGGRVGGCQGGWERRIEAFVKIPKKKLFFFFGGGGGGVGSGASGWGVRVDVNGEVKFL